MRKTRKGFTLIELLIVVAIMGSLAAMMAVSSSESVDTAQAATILSNLQSMKAAAFEMYIEEPKIASKTSITFGTDEKVDTETGATDTRTIAEVLGKYLGKKSDAFTSNGAAKKYGLVGDANSWYVVYAFDTQDSAGVKSKLAAKANDSDLYGWSSATIPASASLAYYTGAAETHIALKVR